MHVVAPDGTTWEVERTWLVRPVTADDAPDPGDDVLESLADRLRWTGQLLSDNVPSTLLTLVAGFIVALVFFVVLPLVFAIVGLLAALAALAARLLSLGRWTVTARSSRVRMSWRVRGFVQSRRAVREVAHAIERGKEPLLAGHRADPVVTAQG